MDSFAIRILKTEELGAGNTIQVSYGTVPVPTSLYVSVRFTFLAVLLEVLPVPSLIWYRTYC